MRHLLKPFIWFWFLCFIAMLSPNFGGALWLYGFLASSVVLIAVAFHAVLTAPVHPTRYDGY